MYVDAVNANQIWLESPKSQLFKTSIRLKMHWIWRKLSAKIYIDALDANLYKLKCIQCYVCQCSWCTGHTHIFSQNFLNIQQIFNPVKVWKSWDLGNSNYVWKLQWSFSQMYVWNLQNLWNLLTIATFLIEQYFSHYVLTLFLMSIQSIQKKIDT